MRPAKSFWLKQMQLQCGREREKESVKERGTGKYWQIVTSQVKHVVKKMKIYKRKISDKLNDI